MDRYPIDESHGAEPPSAPRWPAEERSAADSTNEGLPPTPSAPVPPPAAANRPAGPESVAPVPPPPPYQGGGDVQAGLGAAPPTPRWQRPPLSSTPIRPFGAPTLPPGPSGPPTTPPVVAAGEPTPLGSSRGRWRVAAGALGGMALSAALVGGGYALGEQSNDGGADGSTGQISATADIPQALPADSADGSTTTIEPGPLAGIDDIEEPITAVANAVSASVVLINTGQGQGSGIVWDAENGYIVTNDHVAGSASTVRVLLHNGIEVSGIVIGGDSARDVAVVQVDPEGLNLVEAVFAPTETVDVGQLAVAIGSPFGLDQSVTAGIVSAVNRINQFGGSDSANPVPVSMIQTDAPINPGNSGGALADRDGRVIGMNTSIRTDGSSDNAGVGFAVPSDTIVLIAERIVNGESLELGFLGVSGDTLTDGTIGAIVTDVIDGAPAAAAGIEIGDLIVSLDGSIVATMDELAADFKFFRPGETVELDIVRDGSRITVEVVVGSN